MICAFAALVSGQQQGGKLVVNRILFQFDFGRLYSAEIDSVFGVLAILSFGDPAETDYSAERASFGQK